jgi:hypothetical protein
MCVEISDCYFCYTVVLAFHYCYKITEIIKFKKRKSLF